MQTSWCRAAKLRTFSVRANKAQHGTITRSSPFLQRAQKSGPSLLPVCQVLAILVNMLFSFAIFLLYLSPIAFVFLYSKYEYQHSLATSFKRWRNSKIIGIVFFTVLTFFIATTEGTSWRLSTYWYLLWEPGLSISLIVFSKPASEIVEGFSSLDYFGEDFGHILGWFGLLSVSCVLGVEVLRHS